MSAKLQLSRTAILFSVLILLAVSMLSAAGFLAIFRFSETNRQKLILAHLKCPNCNIILIGVDTLRADHLSSYGYSRQTSPNIDKLAQNGLLFKNAFSASSKTTPSFMSIFTSLWPFDHGILSTLNPDSPEKIKKIDPRITTLAELLKNNGYKTKAFITSPQLPAEVGFGDGFDEYTKGSIFDKRNDFLDWLRNQRGGKFFVFFHDIEPHDPYLPPKPYDTLFDPNYQGKIQLTKYDAKILNQNPQDNDTIKDSLQKISFFREAGSNKFWGDVDQNDPLDINHLSALYDGEIKDLDDFIGELQKTLNETKLGQNTIIVFTADHGEEFKEHQKFKHEQLYNELVHVPLIFSLPDNSTPIQIDSGVRTVDIMPTIADILNIKANFTIRGQSLLPLVVNPQMSWNPQILATQYEGRDKTLISGDYKLIIHDKERELYNLKTDFEEKNNLIYTSPKIAEQLESQLKMLIISSEFKYPATQINLQINQETIENLKDLGYGNP